MQLIHLCSSGCNTRAAHPPIFKTEIFFPSESRFGTSLLSERDIPALTTFGTDIDFVYDEDVVHRKGRNKWPEYRYRGCQNGDINLKYGEDVDSGRCVCRIKDRNGAHAAD